MSKLVNMSAINKICIFKHLSRCDLRINFGFKRLWSSNTSTVEQPQDASLGSEDQRAKQYAPFLKNIFAGLYDTGMLEYPEYPNIEIVNNISKEVNHVEEYFQNCVDSNAIDKNKEIPSDVIEAMKKFKLYGLQVPEDLGGLNLDNRCVARYCETYGGDMSVTSLLNAHNRSLNAILLYGSENLKSALVKKMAAGDLFVGFCLLEKPLLDVWDTKTVALPNGDASWKLNGKKLWVINGDKSDYYLVFAKTWNGPVEQSPQLMHPHSQVLSAFLVDKNTPGVQCGPILEQIGTRGVGICNVEFKDVVIPQGYILGEIGDGANIGMRSVSEGRLGEAAASFAYLKVLLNLLTNYGSHTKVNDKRLCDYEYFQRSLGKIAMDLYALESMIYLTAGVKDSYSNADLHLEECIIKVYSAEKIVEIVDLCANLVGGSAYVEGSPFERYVREAKSYLIHDIVPLSVTKIYIATLGLEHAGVTLNEEIKMKRNPFNFPGYVIKNFFKDKHAVENTIKVQELLRLQLHPSLSIDADRLEKCTVRFEFIVKSLFHRWGVEIIKKQMDLMRLTDIAISLYSMTACLARASRSYCIGLRNSEYEVTTATTICRFNEEKVDSIIDKVHGGPMSTYDGLYSPVSEQITLQKGYMFPHPLDRNY